MLMKCVHSCLFLAPSTISSIRCRAELTPGREGPTTVIFASSDPDLGTLITVFVSFSILFLVVPFAPMIKAKKTLQGFQKKILKHFDLFTFVYDLPRHMKGSFKSV